MQGDVQTRPGAERKWPDGDGPYLFVIEVSGPLERSVLRDWIHDNRPSGIGRGEVQIAELPTTRRSAGRRRRDPALSAFLHGDDDSLVVPLRVVWLAPRRGGQRSVGWIDLLKLGDPRDPDPLRQYVIRQVASDRMRIVVGEPERLSVLRRTWATEEALREGRSFVEEVAHRAWLALERSERQLRGTRYKVPKFPREGLTRSRDFRAGIATQARNADVSYARMERRTHRYVKEIAATHSPYVIDLVTGGFRWLIGKAYDDLVYDREELAALYQMGQRYPLVFLPTHKSHFDHQSLQYALYENGLPPNHTAGGINMNFFPVGPLIRRSGVFFIRREFKDNEPYKFVLRRYIDYLLRRRFPLEWYIEGGRSRTGKQLPPRLGMLAYVVESYLRGSAEDVVFIPVSIAYDQIADVHSYAAEQSGAPKRPETFGWMMRMIRGLQDSYGDIHMRLGAPISLRNFLGDLGASPTDADDTRSPAIPKLAFEIANRINEVTPVTAISLITLVLLEARDHRLTHQAIADRIAPFVRSVQERGIPTAGEAPLGDPAGVTHALDALVTHGIIVRPDGHRDGPTEYQIPADSLLAAAYYRNAAIHHFLAPAIAELAVASAADEIPETLDAAEVPSGRQRYLEHARLIRELLIFEFFFPGREAFDDAMLAELSRRGDDWRSLLETQAWSTLLDRFEPPWARAVLAPFLDAHRIVAEVLDGHEGLGEGDPDSDDLVARAMEAGPDMVESGVVGSLESVSKVLFQAAVKSARHHGAFESAAHRKTFVARLRTYAQLAGSRRPPD